MDVRMDGWMVECLQLNHARMIEQIWMKFGTGIGYSRIIHAGEVAGIQQVRH